MKKIMTLAAVAILMAACNNETEVMDNTSKYITVDANVAGESRVAAKDAFANGDAISVYVWTGESTTLPTGGFVVENSTNTFDGTSWTASPQMLWKDGTTAHHFLSIFPADRNTGEISRSDFINPADFYCFCWTGPTKSVLFSAAAGIVSAMGVTGTPSDLSNSASVPLSNCKYLWISAGSATPSILGFIPSFSNTSNVTAAPLTAS